ncbi:MAG: phosphate/phosphite/phosphonate ABC transporter substrate-binding protein [Gammaproteobacteria bacterium]|jgi:phosphonate transport system substrate-binding protein|nr:phosphate/phosphite/phosphonate ABC transporter substrate-binding protein [Gammaproteobacteria bacterium]
MNLTARPWLLIWFLLFPLGGNAVHSESIDHQSVYTVGIIPQLDAHRTKQIWRPLLDELENRTGLQFTLRGSTTIPEVEHEIMAGDFDFAYMNPYHMLMANKAQGYLPLVRDTGKRLQGIVVVSKHSEIQSVKQLANNTVAFPAPNALGATLLTRSELMDRFRIGVNPLFVKSHSSVYLNVVLGEVAAGGGVLKTLNQQDAAVKNALRILYHTRQVAPHPIAAHPRVPQAVRQKVRSALLAMGQDDIGRELLLSIPIEQIGIATMADYQPLAEMGLERFLM